MESNLHLDISLMYGRDGINGKEEYDDRMEIYSPGGMPDGSMIQDRDPLTVPSTRRNPVLADVFNRLGYMERKGSGFGKIISGYEFQINYNESKRPSFRSDRYQFTVVMPNLNYDVPQDVPQDKLDVQIVDMIRKDRKISTEKMAIVLGVSSKTIVSASKHSVTDKQHSFCYDISNLFFEALFMLMYKTAAFRQFI